MNRQAKRMMAKQKATTQDRVEAAKQRRAAAPNERRKKRIGTRDYLKQVRAELRKVNWPSRREVVGYTVVVLTTVVVVTSYVFGLDLGFSKSLLHIIQGNGG